jgi:hypothetical protein
LGLQEDASLKMWHASKIAIQWENYDKPFNFRAPYFQTSWVWF